jgi:hypothetical protein
MMLQSLPVGRPPVILGEARLQPAHRLAKPAGDFGQGLVIAAGGHPGSRTAFSTGSG